MTTHELKTWPEFYRAILAGEKRHELRRCDDRHFAVGDTLHLREFDPEKGYTGSEMQVSVTYITSAESVCAFSPQALDDKFCILSIALPDTRGRSPTKETP